MAAEVSSIARMLRGEAVKKGGVGPKSEMVTMDLLGGCGGDSAGGSSGDDEVVDLDVKVPFGWERRLDLSSGKTFLTPHRHQAVQGGHQDLNLPPPTANITTSAAVCTLDMVRSALERAAAARTASSHATSSSSSASTSSSSSSLGKRNRSPPAAATTESPANPAMRAAACPSCLTYVLVVEADPLCPRCEGRVPPLAKATGTDGAVKKPKIDLNCAADETE